jgi:hypothetical protein
MQFVAALAGGLSEKSAQVAPKGFCPWGRDSSEEVLSHGNRLFVRSVTAVREDFSPEGDGELSRTVRD